MALRIDPRAWRGSLLAAAGILPFTACGGATTLGPFDDGGSGATATGGHDSAGTTNKAGQAGKGQGGSIGLGGAGGAAAGSGAAAGGVNVAGSGAASAVNRFPCMDPTPYPIPGSGYEMCGGDFVHRTGKAACAPGGECTTDAQCGAGRVCFCQASNYGQCESAACTSDEDCMAGFLCIQGGSAGGLCGAPNGFSCQLPSDACAGNAGCEPCSMCTWSANGRTCQPCCAVGRPFLVAGEARLATLESRADWLACEPTPELAELDTAQREALARYWESSALMEHASIAAFSRFVLDLLSLGAPPELVDDATRAMLDESAHAKLCFGLASSFAATPLGPSALGVSGSLDQRDLTEIVATTVLEGCVGETLAALEAAEALAHASDPAVRSALGRIAEDELRHAALAYRFVRWAITRFGVSVQQVVEDTFRAALYASDAQQLSDSIPAVPSHGLLSAAHRHELRCRALNELIEPTLPSLLAA
jgi:hypothetical protein